MAKLCSSRENDKRSGSDDRDRERDRDLRDKRDRGADRDRDMYKKDKYAGMQLKHSQLRSTIYINYALATPSDKRERSDRGERVARYGDWSEHVSSSGKYPNGSKTMLSINIKSISHLQAKCITITAKLKSPSGRSLRNG